MTKPSKPLFSGYYLTRRLPESSEWNESVTQPLLELQQLYRNKQTILPTLNEAQTESELIQPVLELLGFAYIPQITTRRGGRAERPDYALFGDEAAKVAAYPFQSNDSAFYDCVLAIAEAKYWERPLSKVSANDSRDIFKNTNPSFQIVNYLIGTGVDWGILTNGRIWRLYYRQASSTATEFYEVDLVELLESDDPEAFKYFWLFFRREAFSKDAQGNNFLERVRTGSTTYAQAIGDELKNLVFHQVFPAIAGGFIRSVVREVSSLPLLDELQTRVYGVTLSFLYKLLFLLYAEARNLLPMDNRGYRAQSLIEMAHNIADRIDRAEPLGQTSTALYDRLLNLFQLVDRGDPGFGLPRYNGGLFSESSVTNQFLTTHKLTDAVLAPALDRLARSEGEAIDYSFINVRHLGAIYEGLLEYRLVVDDAANGQVHLETDKGERKATGSYYTPDYIVKYIVQHTLEPILAERAQEFEQLMTQITQLRHQLQDARLGTDSIRALHRDLDHLEIQAWEILLDIKVCDPAMGSGHFLVEAVDFLTDSLIDILNQYPENNPVLERLKSIRQDIIINLDRQHIAITPERLDDTQLLQRVVMKRCIYGVDLNPMAVELAKVSLWLHSFTVGAPLSFLDHHLRCGNSLIGTTARQAEAEMSQDSGGQLTLLTGPFVGLLQAGQIMRGISILSDATLAEVETSERLFKDFDQQAKPYKELLDIYVSRHFGVKGAKNWLQRYGTNAVNINLETMGEADAFVVQESRRLYAQKHFCHWDLEFPEVFIDLESASWKENPGFDAVMGNPPWGGDFSVAEKRALQFGFQTSRASSLDSYAMFTELAVLRTRNGGHCGYIIPDTVLRKDDLLYLRDFLLLKTKIAELVETGPVFKEVRDTWCLLILLMRQKPSKEHNIQHRKLCRFIISAEERLEQFGNQHWSRQSIISQHHWQSRPNLVIGYLASQAEQAIINKIEFLSQPLGRHPIEFNISRGEEGSKFAIQTNKNSNFKMVIPELVERYWTGEGIPIATDSLTPGKFLNYYKRPKIWVIRIQKLRWLQRLVSSFDERTTSAGMKTLQVIVSQNNNSINLLYLSTLLSSRLINFWCTDYLVDDINKSYLEKLPIRNIIFNTPLEERDRYLKEAQLLYQECLRQGKPDYIMDFVSYHLSQKPEQSDVIHDLLAYLAEQMIEMNSQKQTEIKGFLTWLEREIGTNIDSLTNKAS